MMYRDGLGVEKDLSKAADYFKRVKDQENAQYRAEINKFYTEFIAVAASYYENYEYKNSLQIYRQIPENHYRALTSTTLEICIEM